MEDADSPKENAAPERGADASDCNLPFLNRQMDFVIAKQRIDGERIKMLEAGLRAVLEAVTAIGADVHQIRDQMSVLEDAQAMYMGLHGDNTPPPIAEPAQPAKPHRPARRAA